MKQSTRKEEIIWFLQRTQRAPASTKTIDEIRSGQQSSFTFDGLCELCSERFVGQIQLRHSPTVTPLLLVLPTTNRGYCRLVWENAFIADDNEQRDNCDSTDKMHLIIALLKERRYECFCWSTAIDTAQQSANRWQVKKRTEWMNEWITTDISVAEDTSN